MVPDGITAEVLSGSGGSSRRRIATVSHGWLVTGRRYFLEKKIGPERRRRDRMVRLCAHVAVSSIRDRYQLVHFHDFAMTRSASTSRQTSETDISVSIDLDGTGISEIETGIGFFDHMLTLLAKHGCMDLKLKAIGDLHVDQHHTVEDVGICLGQVIKTALDDKTGIRRYGHFTLPMEETLATVAIDLSGRYAFAFRADFPTSKIGDFDSQLVEDFFQSFAANCLCNLHVIVHYGRNSHHVSEAIFKATARALRMAMERDDRVSGVPSTKGTLST